MKSTTSGSITIHFEPGEESTAEIIVGACDKALRLAREIWGLNPPEDCRIYVMTSWMEFVFQSAPWHWRIFLGATIPFWFLRIRRMWPYSAAWTQSYGNRTAIGVKPPRLMTQSDRSIGLRMFVEEKDMTVKMRNVVCHELVHACAARHKLPMWLNEGIAMVTVDRFAGKQTIRQDTLSAVKDYAPKDKPPTYQKVSRLGAEAVAYHTLRGYWLTRYLEGKHPGFLKGLFSQYRDARVLEREIIARLEMTPARFWKEIDGAVVGYFGERNTGA